MTTNSFITTIDFLHFDAAIQNRIVNPRHNEIFSSELKLNEGGNGKHKFISSYDLEIFTMQDEADVFCNIKTKLIVDFELYKQEELSSIAFAETLMLHTVNQKHYATLVLRQNLINNLALIDLLFKPNIAKIYEGLKKEYKFLAPLQFEGNNWNINYWYR